MGARGLVRFALAALISVALPAAAANSPLTEQKWIFARANPCPVNGYKTIACTGWVIVYPACEPWASSMRRVRTADKAAYDAKVKLYCACRARPVEIFACTSRGCRTLAIDCRKLAP